MRIDRTTYLYVLSLSVLLCFLPVTQAFSSTKQSSAFGNKVLSYIPAPGQFIDEKVYTDGGVTDLTQASICNFLTTKMSGPAGSYIVSLGAFGGSIVIGFDHQVKNQGGLDLRVYGNAFYEPGHGPGSAAGVGGNSEPGIVYVSKDDNLDGLPNDKWYELSGSETDNEKTISKYKITYYRPDTLAANIYWTDNQGDSGYVYRNDFHTQNSYYPLWIEGDSISFEGRKLPDNAVNEGAGGVEKWMLYAFDYGYADNLPNASEGTLFDLDWAIDTNGEKVHLENIDFIKVSTAVRQNVGWTGEISTEFAGAEDIGLCLGNEDGSLDPDKGTMQYKVYPNPCTDYIQINRHDYESVSLYSPNGLSLGKWKAEESRGGLYVGDLPKGIYLMEIKYTKSTTSVTGSTSTKNDKSTDRQYLKIIKR